MYVSISVSFISSEVVLIILTFISQEFTGDSLSKRSTVIENSVDTFMMQQAMSHSK